MSDSNNHDDHHVKTYKAVFGALVVLTVVTVLTAGMDFGSMNIFIAMLIATVKATLVMLYFMHLKEDSMENRVVFASAFVFLFIFIGLTGTDLFTREVEKPVQVAAVAAPPGAQVAMMEKLRHVSPELITKGKALYMEKGCVACHGVDGKGNVALKSRDFTSPGSAWTNGRRPGDMFDTITNGVEGTSMAGYDSFKVSERWALVHYLRTFMTDAPKDNKVSLAKVGIGTGIKAKVVRPELPVDFAIERLIEEAKPGQ